MKKFLIFAILFFVGYDVFALEYGNGVYVTNNTTISVTDTNNVGYTIPQGQNTSVHNVTDVFIGLGLNISYSLVKDRYYELEVHLSKSHFNDLANNITIYSSNNVCALDGTADFTTNYPKIRFHCNENVSGLSIVVNNDNNQNALITTAAEFYYNYAFLRYAKSVGEEITGSLTETNEKLDDINDNISDINDYLQDDTYPQVDTDAISDVMGSISYTDPLGYLLSLPVRLINTIVANSDSCSTIDLGTLYGVHIYLPCIDLENILGSSVWNTIDVIGTISILVVILKKFYNTITNLLTLGAQEEAREKFELPTPMDFMAWVLGSIEYGGD